MVYLRHPEDPIPLIAEGIWEGVAVTAPRGSNGFGYDPMFYVPSHQCTSAELSPEVKNRISHRAQALSTLIMRLNECFSSRKIRVRLELILFYTH
jgi:Xanthosine triphosphate pyrophosphatase